MKRKKTGGRSKGVPNKQTSGVKAYSKQFTEKAIDVLWSIAENPEQPAAARVSAANAILDRGEGKVPQAVTGEDGGPIDMRTTVIHEYRDSAH